jgi:hypothetical protein
MALVRVGYKRLYNSLGCSLQSEKPVEISLRLSELESRIYIGRDPSLGISAATGSRYYILGQSGSLGTMSFGRKDVSASQQIDLLTEICCIKEIEVDNGTAAAFYAGDSKATQDLFQIIELKADVFRESLDLIAGTIGLRFHRQFVIEILAENPVAFKNDGTPAQTYHGNTVEVLENLSMRDSGRNSLESMLQQVADASKNAQDFGASALRWLLRSWRERDPFAKFMSLFIPLEVILAAVKYDNNEIVQQRDLNLQIEAILREHGGTESDKLISKYKKLRQLVHPPLSARFECLAENAQIEGWKADIVAFKRFKKKQGVWKILLKDMFYGFYSEVKSHIRPDTDQTAQPIAVE